MATKRNKVVTRVVSTVVLDCPKCGESLSLDEQQVKSLYGKLMSAKRKSFGAGPGRPAKPKP